MIFILNPNPTSLSFSESWSFNNIKENLKKKKGKKKVDAKSFF